MNLYTAEVTVEVEADTEEQARELVARSMQDEFGSNFDIESVSKT